MRPHDWRRACADRGLAASKRRAKQATSLSELAKVIRAHQLTIYQRTS